jgi:hypothetical protein
MKRETFISANKQINREKNLKNIHSIKNMKHKISKLFVGQNWKEPPLSFFFLSVVTKCHQTFFKLFTDAQPK